MSNSQSASTHTQSYPYPVQIPMTPPNHSPHSNTHSLSMSLSLSSPHLYTPILQLPNMTPNAQLYSHNTDTPVGTPNNVPHQFPSTYHSTHTPINTMQSTSNTTSSTQNDLHHHTHAMTSNNTAPAATTSVPTVDININGTTNPADADGGDGTGAPIDPALVLMNLKPRGQKHPKHYWCEICTKGFTQKGSLVKHMLTHTGEKPYKCTIDGCTRAFAQSGNLARHYRSHTDEKLFSCTYCNKNFRRRDTVRQHEMTHTAPYLHTQSNNAQNTPSTLNVHNDNNNNMIPSITQQNADTQHNTHSNAINSNQVNSMTGHHTNVHMGTDGMINGDTKVIIPELPHLNTLQNGELNVNSTVSMPSTQSIHSLVTDITHSTPIQSSYTVTAPNTQSSQFTLAPPINAPHIKSERKRSNDTIDNGSIIVKKQIVPSEAPTVLRRAKDIQPVQQWSLDANAEDAYVLITATPNSTNDTNTTVSSTDQSQYSTISSVPPSKQASQSRPFKCTRCSRGFKTRGAVIFHARTHLQERPFKCDINGCEKSFKQKSNLLQHISSVHAQLRLYECSRCGRQFKTKFSAQQHEMKQRCSNIQKTLINQPITNNTLQPLNNNELIQDTANTTSAQPVSLPSNTTEHGTGNVSNLLMLSTDVSQ